MRSPLSACLNLCTWQFYADMNRL